MKKHYAKHGRPLKVALLKEADTTQHVRLNFSICVSKKASTLILEVNHQLLGDW